MILLLKLGRALSYLEVVFKKYFKQFIYFILLLYIIIIIILYWAGEI